MEQMILLVTVISLMLVIILIFLIRRNILRLEKKKTMGTLIDAKVTKWKALSGQPTRYIFEVEYEMGNEKHMKRLITSGKFAKKYEYEKERSVPIVVIPDTNKVYFEEENWKKQNIFLISLISLIILVLPGLIMFLFYY